MLSIYLDKGGTCFLCEELKGNTLKYQFEHFVINYNKPVNWNVEMNLSTGKKFWLFFPPLKKLGILKVSINTPCLIKLLFPDYLPAPLSNNRYSQIPVYVCSPRIQWKLDCDLLQFSVKGADPALKPNSVLYLPQNWRDHWEGDWHSLHWGSKYLWSGGWRKVSQSRERAALLSVWSWINTQWSTEKNERKSGDTKGKHNREGLRILHLYTKTLKNKSLHKVLHFYVMSFLFSFFFLLPCRFQKINGQRHLRFTCNSCKVSCSVAFPLDKTCLVNKGRCTLKHGREYRGSSTNGFQATIPWAYSSHGTLVLTGLKLSISCQMDNVSEECWRILLS